LCDRLRGAGIEVTSTHRAHESGPAATTCDITDADQVDRVVAGCKPDWVFQCAGATATGNPREMYRLHVGGTLNVLDAIHRHVQKAHVVLLGSAAEYGPVPPELLPVGESYSCAPTSFFGASKHAQSEIARAAATEWRLHVVTARPFNIIGPGLPPHYFAASLARRFVESRPECQKTNESSGGRRIPFPVANADATRDFIDVRDAADALIAIARWTPKSGQAEVFNIATGTEVTILSAARRLAELAGGYWEVIDGDVGKSRSSIHRSCGDASKLREQTGWRPTITWEKSLEDLWNEHTKTWAGLP
jgi:GDP-4-dehydro-6-deoxy-D-mannose reductase